MGTAPDGTPAGGLASLLGRHRRDAVDFAALGLSLALTGWLIAPVPASVAVCSLVCAALVPLRPAGAAAGPWREFLAAAPRRLATVAVAGAVLHFFLDQPPGALWFGALWAAAGWLLAANPGRVDGVARGAVRLAELAQGRALAAADGLAPRPRLAEALRMSAAAAAGLFALGAFLHNGIIGGSDGAWYAAMVADHLKQWRMGMGPVFVGQTRFAAIGTVIPLRVAPYLQHLTLALDFLTGRALSPYLLLNLAVALSGAAGGLSAYLCLRSILGSRRLEALLLAVLYIWCPGVIGLPYTGQLFMSAMTMPYLPLVLAGVVRIFRSDDFSGWAMVSVGCAACWLCHSPIGIWVSASAAFALLIRWACGLGWTGRELVRIACAGLLFAGLCGYVFVSFATLAPEPDTPLPSVAIVRNLQDFFPRILLPVSRTAAEATDLQIGWGLLATLVGASVVAWRRRLPAARALSGVALLLLCLTLPVPGLTSFLWGLVPQAVVDATNAVPNQRLIAILAACSVVVAATSLAAWRGRRRWALCFLGLAVAWSGFELREFLHRGTALQNTRERSEAVLSEENFIPTRFSLGMLSYRNRFFSNGFMDNELEQRVLAPDMASYVATNIGAIAPASEFGRKAAHRELPDELTGSSLPGDRVWVTLSPGVTVLPHRHYLLAMDFTDPDTRGVFVIAGGGLYRAYDLPASGGAFAFGAAPLSSWVLPISSARDSPLELSLSFSNGVPDTDMARYQNFARYELIEYDPGRLPIRLKSLLPYVALVRSPSKGWYESFRYFTPGWTATVNGRPAEVRRSPNSLIAVPVGAGESEVRLLYRPPAPLLASYWLTVATWAGLAAFLAVRSRRGSFSWAGLETPATLRDP